MLWLAFFAAADQNVLDAQRSRPTGTLAAARLELLSPATTATPRSGDGDWRMIDAFTELRRQQARVLRFAM
jgi:hypothetical protein